jgi:hypothetical protein
MFYDDVVAHRQAKPGTFARGLGGEERVEYFLFDLFRDAGAVIANTDFNGLAEVFRGGDQDGLKGTPSSDLRWVAA